MNRILGLVTSGIAFVLLYALASSSKTPVTLFGFTFPMWILGFVLYLLGVAAAYFLTRDQRS